MDERSDCRTKRNDLLRTTLEIVLTYPGFHALFWHRWEHFIPSPSLSIDVCMLR